MPAVKYRPSAAITSTLRSSESPRSSTAARRPSIMAGDTAFSFASLVKVTVSTPSSSDRRKGVGSAIDVMSPRAHGGVGGTNISREQALLHSHIAYLLRIAH